MPQEIQTCESVVLLHKMNTLTGAENHINTEGFCKVTSIYYGNVNQLWHVATVNWCEDPLACPVVTPVDRLYEEGEYAQ